MRAMNAEGPKELWGPGIGARIAGEALHRGHGGHRG
jgi:hypothetical protein